MDTGCESAGYGSVLEAFELVQAKAFKHNSTALDSPPMTLRRGFKLDTSVGTKVLSKLRGKCWGRNGSW